MTVRPERLLIQADLLAGRRAGRGRPSETNHRRAVSAAYYAVFHASTDCAATFVLPNQADDEQRGRVRRWIPHAHVKTACEYVVKASALAGVQATEPRGFGGQLGVWPLISAPAPGGRAAQVSQDVEVYARHFLRLQEARHDADYDHGASFPKSVTLTYIAEARRAYNLLDSYGTRDDFGLLWTMITGSPPGFSPRR